SAPTTRSRACIFQWISSSGRARTLTGKRRSSPRCRPPSCGRGGYSMQPSPAKLQLVQAWMTKALHDLLAAEELSRRVELRDTAVYHCQQTAEKALKGFLVWVDIPPPRMHSLTELVLVCASTEGAFSSLDPAARTLSPYA